MMKIGERVYKLITSVLILTVFGVSNAYSEINTKEQIPEVNADIFITYESKEFSDIKNLDTYTKEENTSQYEEWLFEVSYYCACYDCTQNGDGQTASGYYAEEGVTIAAPKDIPFGSTIHIEGVGEFIVQDRGEYIQKVVLDDGTTAMRVDIFLENHDECLDKGRHYENGYIVKY